MKNCKLISTAVASIILGSSAYAGGIDSFLNGAVMTQSTGGGTVSTSAGTMLYGGNFQMRAKTVNIHPISATAPSIHAGCGGISATLGSLSFLNMNQIVSLLQGMMANAPGVMFEMGLKVICPSCMDTLNALEQLANQINGMNLDSCSLDKKAASWIEGEMGNDVQTGTSSDYHEEKDSFGIKDFTGHVASINKWLNDSGCNSSNGSCGAKYFMQPYDALGNSNSFLDFAFNNDFTDSYFTGDSNFIMSMRALAGDIIKQDGGGEKQGSFKYISAITTDHMAPDAHVRTILAYLVGDITITSSSNTDVLDSNGNTYTLSVDSTIKTQILNGLNSIADKINNRDALSPSDIAFLNSFRMPVYLIINRLAQIPNGVQILSDVQDELANMLAYEVLYEYISRTVNVMARERMKITEDILNKIPFDCGGANNSCSVSVTTKLKDIQKGLRTTALIAYDISATASKKLNDRIAGEADLFNKINELSNFTLMRSNGDIFSNYAFSKTLINAK